MTGSFRTAFVFSSFGPLYIIVWIKLWLALGFFAPGAVVFLALSILAVIVTVVLSNRLATDGGQSMPIKDAQPVDSEVFPYLMTYIPIFLENDVTNPSFLYPVVVLYLIIFILFMRLDTPHLHPYFAFLGLRVYGATLVKNDDPIVIICSGRRLSTTEKPILHEVGTGDLYYCDMKNKGRAEDDDG